MPKGCSRSIRLFGRDLKSWLRRDGWGFLPQEYSDWAAGGCWLLARALHEWIGKPSELWAVYSEVGSDVLRPDRIPQHVVLRIGDCFLDGDGASTEKQLLDRWEKVEGLRDPELRPANIAELEELMMECPVGPLKDLKRGLEQTFGASLKDR
jgi:hypothetical protein